MTAKKQMKDQQQHYDDLTNVPCGDTDSDLVFTENPECLQIDLGVVKGNHLTKQGKPIKSDVQRKDGDRVETITPNQLQVQREERSVTKQTGNTGLRVMGVRELGVVKKKQTQPSEPLVVRAKHRQPTNEVQVIKRETKAPKLSIQISGHVLWKVHQMAGQNSHWRVKALVQDRSSTIHVV
ncbi:uncharacterized protein [Ptychodera flava]|uniref:uncharacterized protein n=1 Tax=Ptychodera flava TaxID=63121 RepID=UPI00396A5FC2